jgi:hypothetical protein
MPKYRSDSSQRICAGTAAGEVAREFGVAAQPLTAAPINIESASHALADRDSHPMPIEEIRVVISGVQSSRMLRAQRFFRPIPTTYVAIACGLANERSIREA